MNLRRTKSANISRDGSNVLSKYIYERKMIRKRYDITPQSLKDTRRERDANLKNGIKYKKAKAQSHEESSFLTDVHQIIYNIQNKVNKTSSLEKNVGM